MRTDHDAIVIGAGPAGSTAAIRLAQAGWSVALIEKHPFPRRKVCGECIAATNLPLLDALGLGAAFDAAAGPSLRRMAVMAGDCTVQAALPARSDTRHPWGRALGREILDAMLIARAEELGVMVLQPWTVRSIDPLPEGHLCEVRPPGGGQAVRLSAPVAIAAYGSWESAPAVHERARPPQRPDDLFAFKANFSGTQLPDGLLPVLALAGCYGGMVVADRGMTTLACCIRRDKLRALRAEADHASAASAVDAYLRAECSGVRAALDGARCEGAWLSVGPIRPGVRMPHAAHEPFMVGNAAGEAHPIIGEGISMAMQSAWLLCERLLSVTGSLRCSDVRQRVGRDYAGAWRRAFVPRIRLAALLAHAAMRPRSAGLLLPALQRWPQALTGAARLSGKVRCAVDPDASIPH